MPARRASTALFAIEARTAHLVLRSRRAMAWHETARTSADRERAFLDALAGARELPLEPSIQDLERFAPRWADLAPSDPDLCAAIARLLGQKYRFTAATTPRLRTTLRLDRDDVRASYQRLHGEPLEAIYAPQLSARDRLRWRRADLARRLEELPPFWSAYALSLTEAVGAGILALPIALAGVGPLPGIAFLVVLGLLNVVTIGGLVESITRSGEMRYGAAYFGRLAGALLGRTGASAITFALFAFNAVTFLAYLVAFSLPLADATPLGPSVWVVALFIVNLYFLRRDLNATVASALAIGAINIAVIVAISTIALTHVDNANLLHARLPFIGAHPANAAVLALVFGVGIVAYFGHTSCGNVAKLILEREPSGRALFRGNVAATATIIVLYSLAVLAINGALAPSDLAGYHGTALEPLANHIGPAISVLGSIYVVLAVGLASIYVSLGMANQVREWLPARLAANQRNAFMLSVAPAVVVFAIVEWLTVAGKASFADPLAVVGTLAVPLLGGIFPMLLLAASRSTGEFVPASIVRVLRGPTAMGAVGLAFFIALVVQGFVIWHTPAEQAASALAAGVSAVVVWMALRSGAFRPRAIVELRREPAGNGAFGVTVAGKPASVAIELTEDGPARSLEAARGTILSFGTLHSASFELPATPARELKVWVHEVTAEGDSRTLPAVVQVRSPSVSSEKPLAAGDPAPLVAIGDSRTDVRIDLGTDRQ